MKRLKHINPAGTVRRFYVAFIGGPPPATGTAFWTYRFVRHDFRHALAFFELGGQVVVLNPLWNGLWIEGTTDGVPAILERLRGTGSRVVVIDTVFPEREIWPGALAYYCIPFLKALLGISDWRVWTPYQLHRKLLAMGGQEVALA